MRDVTLIMREKRDTKMNKEEMKEEGEITNRKLSSAPPLFDELLFAQPPSLPLLLLLLPARLALLSQPLLRGTPLGFALCAGQ